MFLFFKNKVKKNSGIHFTNFVNLYKLSASKQQHLCLNLTVYNYWRDANNFQQEKKHLFLYDKLLFHTVFSYSEQIYCENLTMSGPYHLVDRLVFRFEPS